MKSKENFLLTFQIFINVTYFNTENTRTVDRTCLYIVKYLLTLIKIGLLCLQLPRQLYLCLWNPPYLSAPSHHLFLGYRRWCERWLGHTKPALIYTSLCRAGPGDFPWGVVSVNAFYLSVCLSNVRTCLRGLNTTENLLDFGLWWNCMVLIYCRCIF